MRSVRLIFILAIAVLFACGPLAAGELSSELVDKISGKSPDDLIEIWIKLRGAGTVKQLKASIAAASTDKIERHRETLIQLQGEHFAAQEPLLTHLKGLRRNARVKNIKPHWIANLIEAEISVGELRRLTDRDDIETIYPAPKITSIVPDEIQSAPSVTTGVESNLSYINAPAAWAAGYTGKGRIICSFDTGVEGSHPALFDNWKGHDGDSAAAWFDPKDHEPFPHYIPHCGFLSCNPNHGTHVMGIMVGHDDVTRDTIGVAPGARWISAAVIDIAGVSIIDAFEWAADPDGDPNSIDDVPDVINHSWGVPFIDCENVFYDIIDNIEALGIVNIFAAGNRGKFGASTILNPANRARNSLDCFAVGNLDHVGDTVTSKSSRGPSDCNIGAVKPNVVAPGYVIRSSVPGGGYSDNFAGTSIAAPHVSGLVALLREKNPNATVEQIKNAILTSTNNLGYTLPNNDMGWGVVDCMTALNALPAANPAPNVRVYSFDHEPISPGDTVIGTLVLKNLGATVHNVEAMLADDNPSLDVLHGYAGFGTIAEDDTSRAGTTFRVVVSDTITVGSILSLDLLITGAGYSATKKLYFLVEPRSVRSFVTHDVGNVEFTVSNFGTFGMGEDSFFPAGGVGFKYKGGPDYLWEGGVMIGSNITRVSDGVHNIIIEPDGDFGVLPGGNIEFVTPQASVSQQTCSRFSDERAENPIGLDITQNSYAFDYNPYEDFIILQYIITNTSSLPLYNLYVGIFLDWDIVAYPSNAGGYESDAEFMWIAFNAGASLSNYRGAKILHGSSVTAFTEKAELVYPPDEHGGGGDSYTEYEKMLSLADGFGSSDSFKNNSYDLFQVTAVKIDLGAGETDTAAFAILAGDGFADIQNAAQQSQEAYLSAVTDVKDNGETLLPQVSALHQNYPNPFNPTTTISFDLKTASAYSLTVYNLNGQKVDQITGWAKAGRVEIEWNGDLFASGIYLYKLQARDFAASKKMLLLK